MEEYRRYRRRPPRQSTSALTVKLAMLAVVATLAVGGLIAAQMAAGNDPSLGPKSANSAKKATAKTSSSASSSGAPSGSIDPYAQSYGGDGYNGSSSGYSSGSGYSTQQSAPAPVTSGTS
jgi:hypothetical protein